MFKEPQSKKDIWNPYFYNHFQGFSSIIPLWTSLLEKCQQRWPTVSDYNDFAKTLSSDVSFIEQLIDMRYLWEIYTNRKIPTRTASWHDFFNNLTWLVFPKLKWAIVQKMCQDPLSDKTRTSLQNTLAHFDECGIVICSDKPELFNLIKDFQWKAFFCHTHNLPLHCLPIIIGHGLMEKALSPYIGMTAKAVFLTVESDFFNLSPQAQNAYVDESIASYILSEAFPCQPKSLHPFPLLGWPTWHQDNHLEVFYENESYFRKGRIGEEV